MKNPDKYLACRLLVLRFILSLALSRSSWGAEEKLRVVASMGPLRIFARQVGGDKVDVL